jgi:excisionase family DNA binding protein
MNTAQEPAYLTLPDAAKRLSISVSTLRRRIDEGKIEAIQLGGKGTRWLIPVEAIRFEELKQTAGAPQHSQVKRKGIPGRKAGWRNS